MERLKQSKVLWYAISTLILLALILAADIQKFLQAISSVDPFYMSLAVLAGISPFLVWGGIWHSFFRKLGIETSLSKSYRMFMAGNFMNAITPLGQFGGEPFMAYLVSKNTDASYEKSLSSVMSSDLINATPFMTYITAGVAYIVVFGSLNLFIKRAAYATAVFALIFILAAYLLWFDRVKLEAVALNFMNFFEQRLDRELHFLDSLRERAREAKETFEEIGEDPRHLLKTAFLAHLAPVANIFSLYFVMLGLGLDPHFMGLYFTTILSGLALFSPTPGGSGTYEATFSGLLLFFYPGIGLDMAVAAAVLFRIATYWTDIPIGYTAMLTLKNPAK